MKPSRPSVDAVMLESRAATLASRSIKLDAKAAAIDLAIACLDLTSLEGRDSPDFIQRLCARAVTPAAGAPSVAAVCVYPSHVATAKAALRGTSVRVASVAAGFPSALTPLAIKLAEIDAALAAGADEIDIAIDRGALLIGNHTRVLAEIAAARRAAEHVVLKVIVEAGELGSYATVRRATDLALAGGADFIKTATGTLPRSSTPAVALLFAESVREHARRTQRRAGLKLAGGIRTTKSALGYLAIVKETLGDAWLEPRTFRFGASGLLDDLLAHRHANATGAYLSPGAASVG